MSFDIDPRGGEVREKKKYFLLVTVESATEDYTAWFPSLPEYWVRSLGPAREQLNCGPDN